MAKKKFLDKQFFEKLAKDVIPMYRKHIFIDAKDVNDKPFPKEYSQPYGSLKKAGRLPMQDKASAGSTAPYLTGALMRDFKMIKNPDSKGFSFGTSSYGGRVNNLAKMKKKRVLSTDKKPLPDKIEKHVIKSAVKYCFEEVLKKEIKGKTIKIKL